jgi:membrane-associated PAP2 superfamily phosphatase
MDGVTLLSEGRAAGLTIMADGGRLVIRGPRSADAVARRLLAHKAVVLATLAADDGSSCPWEAMEPGPGCPVCGSLEQWQDGRGCRRCGVCEADALDKALKLVERAARLRKRRSCQSDNAQK